MMTPKPYTQYMEPLTLREVKLAREAFTLGARRTARRFGRTLFIGEIATARQAAYPHEEQK